MHRMKSGKLICHWPTKHLNLVIFYWIYLMAKFPQVLSGKKKLNSWNNKIWGIAGIFLRIFVFKPPSFFSTIWELSCRYLMNFTCLAPWKRPFERSLSLFTGYFLPLPWTDNFFCLSSSQPPIVNNPVKKFWIAIFVLYITPHEINTCNHLTKLRLSCF